MGIVAASLLALVALVVLLVASTPPGQEGASGQRRCQ
jgi:hypothetical protein